MLEIHQILVAASLGDAVTHSALEIQDFLAQRGPSEIFSLYRDPALEGRVRLLREYETLASSRSARNVLVYHAAIGEPDVVAFLMSRPERLALMYHNITPSKYFWDYDPRFALSLEQGRLELRLLRERVALAVAVSRFNARELEELGYRNVRIASLLADPRSLARLPPDRTMENRLRQIPGGPVVLFVGQFLPHKRQDLLLETHHVLTTYLVPEARLVLVGASHLPWYTSAIRRIVEELNLQGVWLTGRLSEGELAAMYRLADVFVTMSEHEGFCVPLLEAMCFGLPVVARDYGAIAETLDGGGLVLPPDAGPLLTAEALAELLSGSPLRASLLSRGRKRLRRLNPRLARSALLAHLEEIAA